MRNSISPKLLIITCVAMLVLYSCKNDNKIIKTPVVPDQSFVEEFDTVSAATKRGWQLVNTSDPLGSGIWKDGGGNPPFFNAYSNKGTNAGFIGADYLSTSADQGTISNWLISPSVLMQNGDTIIFYTRSYTAFDGTSDTTDFGNSLQVRINPTNDNIDVGKGLTTGNFTQVLLNINPNLVWSSVIKPNVIAFPTQWTRFITTVSGLTNTAKSRFAFRYFVTSGGSNGNASGVGIDSVAYISVGH